MDIKEVLMQIYYLAYIIYTLISLKLTVLDVVIISY